MPHKRPPSKSNKEGSELMRLMLVRQFLKKNAEGGGDSVEINSSVTNEVGSLDMASQGVEVISQVGGSDEDLNHLNDSENFADLNENGGKGPDYVFVGTSRQVGGMSTEPGLVTQLRELKRTLQKNPVVQLGGSDLQDFLTIHKELGQALEISQESCGQLTRYAQENILGLAKELKTEISYNKIGHSELERQYDIKRIDQFLEKYENMSCMCQADFQKIYQEVQDLRNTMEKDLSQNDFSSNNSKLAEMLGVDRGGIFGWGSTKAQTGGSLSPTQVNQLLRSNQRCLDECGEQMIGNGLVNEFRKLQVKAQKKISIDLGSQTGGRFVGLGDDEQSLFGESVGVLSSSEREAKYQYIDAKRKLLEKQADLLEIKKAKLESMNNKRKLF